MISTRIVCRQFVGRDEELEHLVSRRRQAGDAHGGLVLVGGEPGIGKSRLVRAFQERLTRSTSIVASSACREFAQKPLGPLLEILGKIAGSGASSLACSSKSEQLEIVAQTFERVAAKRTTVVILEDVHWADADLIQTLLVLVRRAASQRLLFVATYRDNELSPSHPLFKWFGQLVREPAVSVVTLPPFTGREIDRLMAHALPATVTLAPPVLHAVRDRSDGNPLFAEELLRSAVESTYGEPADVSPALPLSLHALVAERLQECSAAERAFLRHASLAGRTFSVGDVCDIFGTVPALPAILDRLCGLQLVDAVDPASGRYCFRHALTRDVVYGEIPRENVRHLHRQMAEHVEGSPEANDVPEVLGHHFWAAGRPERAAPYYERAGDAAMAVFAYDDAAAFYRRAGEGFAGDRAARARAFARAARALMFAGDLDDGFAQYERATGLMLELGDVSEVVRNRALMAGHLFDGGRREAAIALLRATLSVAERGETSLQVRLRTRLAMMLARDGQLDDAWNTLGAIDAAALDPGAELTGEYYLCASELHALRADPEPFRSCFEKGVRIYEALGHPGPLQVAHSNFAVQALSVGEMELARTHNAIAAELARTLHFDDQEPLRAQVALYGGDLSEARRILEGTPTPQRFLMRATLVQVAVPLAIALGDDRMLERYDDERILNDAGPGPFSATMTRVAAARAMALAATNRRGEARMLLGRVLASLNTTFGMTLPIVTVATILSERAGEMRPFLEAEARRPADRAGKALRAFVEAAIASHHGDVKTATVFAAEAAQRFAAIGWPLLEARSLEMCDRRSAVAIYERAGAAGELRRLEFGAVSEERTELGVLTARERELALLVAAGKPNRAIATTLSIGEKAVEKYLTSIYSKLGLTSRAHLAALVAASQRSSR